MTETEYRSEVARILEQVQDAVDASGIDADCALNGDVLTVSLDGGSRLVVSAQAPLQQIWLAARSGGMHFGYDGARWKDVRSGEEFFGALSRAVSEQEGRPVQLRPG